MLKAMNRPQRALPVGATEPADVDLMLAVARNRDVAAYEQLYRRYERTAYNLALNLTSSSASAEEAVQEAMMKIWRSASNFRADGNFKGWFLRIVADCSLDHGRRGWREKRRALRHAQVRPREAAKDLGGDLEHNELHRALQKQMGKLDELERRLLALYYGADMSQQEIGHVLDVPQTTVSMKMREALGKLRSGLTAAGFAAAVPLLDSGALGDAVLNGVQAPPGLHGWIMESLGRTAHESLRGGMAATSTWMGWLAAGLVVLLGIGAWSAMAPGRPSQMSAAPSLEPVAEEGPRSPAADSAPLRILGAWDFNTPEKPEAIEFSYGRWAWSPDKGPGGSGCLWTPGEVTILLDLPVSRLPVQVSYRRALASFDLSTGGSACVIGWEAHQGLAHFRNIGKLFTIDTSRPPPWQTDVWYLSKDAIAGTIDGELLQLFLVERHPDARLIMILPSHYYIDDLEVREIAEDELPDLAVYRKAVQSIPAPSRQGTVELPQLKSPRESRKVFVEIQGPATLVEAAGTKGP